MSHWLDEPRSRQDVVTVPILWVTIALSLLIHGAALFLWIPRTLLFAPGDQEHDLASDRLQVRLAAAAKPTPAPPPEPSREIPAPAKPAAPPPRATLRTRPAPVVTAPNPEALALASPPPPTPPVPVPERPDPPIKGDLWSYIEARRLERGEPQDSTPDDDPSRLNRSLAANLPAPATGVASQDRKRGGGMFEIKRMSYDDAAFAFYGWNNEMQRKTPQLIEVRKGNNSDMRIAVVRKMIEIIREFSKDDFLWQSPRRDGSLVLSARLSDNASLEVFLMHEFFDDLRQPR